MSRDRERRQSRLERLRRFRSSYSDAAAACDTVWRQGRRRPRVIFIRQGLVAAGSLVADQRWTGQPPPLARLARARGIALQVLLLALFEAQCSRVQGSQLRNGRPVRGYGAEIGWLDFVASPAQTAKKIKEPVTESDNRLRQFKQALRALNSSGHVEIIGKSGNNGRFENFRLLNEDTSAPFRRSSGYSVPASYGNIPVPVNFFLKGWVHVLTPAEIATYLMFRHLATQFPERHAEDGVFVTGKDREEYYGLSRDIYESHHELSVFGIVNRQDDETRHPDGKIVDFKNRNKNEFMQPHRFKISQTEFAGFAIRNVVRALENPARWNE